jgi:REP-associated tyrosine transposase
MSRERRIEAPGSFHHLVSRGNNRQVIFDDFLRSVFLSQLSRVARRHDWRVLVYVLMSNHFHVVLRLGDGGLSDGMRELNTGFAVASNLHFGRINHCFGARFWDAQLETEQHLLASIRYALWNPPRAGVGAHPGDSSWSSFRASIGAEWAPRELPALHELLGLFGRTPREAQRAFRRFVTDGRERCLAPWRDGAGIVT